jgi:hypothetical protein
MSTPLLPSVLDGNPGNLFHWFIQQASSAIQCIKSVFFRVKSPKERARREVDRSLTRLYTEALNQPAWDERSGVFRVSH